MDKSLVLKPFVPDHVRLMDFEREEMRVMIDLQERADYAARLAKAGPAWSLFDSGGLIVGSAGVGVYWPGVGEAWALLSLRANRFMFSVHKLVKQTLPHLIQELNLHRLQTVVPADSDRALRWVEALGFRSEGLMRKYGPDMMDYYRFARLT